MKHSQYSEWTCSAFLGLPSYQSKILCPLEHDLPVSNGLWIHSLLLFHSPKLNLQIHNWWMMGVQLVLLQSVLLLYNYACSLNRGFLAVYNSLCFHNEAQCNLERKQYLIIESCSFENTTTYNWTQFWNNSDTSA